MKIAKHLVQTILGKFGYRISRISDDAYLFPNLDFSFDILDYIIFKIWSENNHFYFVQVGANDGILSDNLRPLIKKYRLPGLLVEPMPDVFLELVSNYDDQPQLTFINCAIGLKDQEIEIFRFMRDAPVPTDFFHGLARQDGEYIKARAKTEGLENYVERLRVPMWTFNRLRREKNIEEVTLLYIDTEGSDKEIITSAFESGCRPLIIHYESTEMTRQDRYECKLMLLDNGYRFLDVGPDVICLRMENLTKCPT